MEHQNFFNAISPHLGAFDSIRLTLTKKEDRITVIVFPVGNHTAGYNIPKLKTINVAGTADELDKTFFVDIQRPMEATKGYLSNVEEYEADVKAAKSKLDEQRKKKMESSKGKDKEKESSKEDKAAAQIKENDAAAAEVIRSLEDEGLKGRLHLQLKAVDDFLSKKLEVSEPVKKQFETTRAQIVDQLTSPQLF